MKYLVSLLLSLAVVSATAQTRDLSYYYNKAQEAYKSKDYPLFYEMIQEAHKIHPYHQGVLYQMGLAAALTGRKEEAIAQLKKAVLINAGFKLEGLPDFNTIKDTPGFRALLDLQKELQRSVVHSDTAFVLSDRSLHTEGIAHDPAKGIFYVGSIRKRKIVKITPPGTESDFCASGFEGMTCTLGIKVDLKRNVLWACSSPMDVMVDFDSTARSAVFCFDLATGKLIEKFQRPKWDKDGVYGDLVLNAIGSVFISDSQTNTVFTINEKSHQLEPYFTSPDFWNIQGIVFSEKDHYLFIADYIKGLFRLDTKTKVLTQIKCDLELSLKGIDGLMYFAGSLIAIQNGVSPAVVTRLFLNSSHERITRFETIDRNHPAFNEPTLGVVTGNTLYYIANSQWSGYDANHKIKPDAQLQDIVVLKTDAK